MKHSLKILLSLGLIFTALMFVACQKEELIMEKDATLVVNSPNPSEEIGNNLSFPVIWSDGFELELREPTSFGPQLEDEWWYVWGDEPLEPNDPVYSCRPDPNNPSFCEDKTLPGAGSKTYYRAYLQKRENNSWQAANWSPAEPMYIDLIDWGDNLESKDWSIRSNVRTELVLYENLTIPVLNYAMRHVSGWGKNEMHGLQTDLGDNPILAEGSIATMYSHNVRFTIQKLNVHRDSIPANSLSWIPNEGWTESDPNGQDIINAPIMNQAVYEAEEGHAYFSSEVNIKGKIIYGYTWKLPNLNEGIGYYRITYSFDDTGGVVDLNTFFDENSEIIIPVEGSPGGDKGGTAVIDINNNLTYMDIRIKQQGGGGGGGGH